MAKIADVLQIERNRTDKSEWNKIHLFKMGDFWRAYEWSAWLVAVISYNDKVRMATKDRKPLKLTRKQLAKSDDTFCFVGFPIKSISKFIPVRTDFTSNDDKHLVCTIELPQPTDGSEITYERMNEAMTSWKNTIEISTKEDIVDENGNVIEKPARQKTSSVATTQQPQIQQPAVVQGGGLISRISGYQLQDHTDIENRMFIASLQQMVAQIL